MPQCKPGLQRTHVLCGPGFRNKKKNLQNFSDFACNLAKNVISLAVANFWLVHLIDGLFYWLNVSLR